VACHFNRAGTLAVAGLLCGASFAAPVVVPAGLYAVSAETLLPHLEENLRYATTVTRRCLGTQDATALFPLLAHEAFAGCTLVPEPGTADEPRFTLRCHTPRRPPARRDSPSATASYVRCSTSRWAPRT
jgi:hypothetical protein